MTSESNERPVFGTDVGGDQQRIVVESPTDSIKIEQLIPEDAQAYFDLIEFDRKHLSQIHVSGRKDETADKYDTVEKMEDSITNSSNPRKLRFGIWNGEKMVGSVNLTPLVEGMAEIGAWVGKEHIGNNYSSRGAALLIDYAFNSLRLDRIYAEVEVGNNASRKSVEKLGFEYIGELKNKKWVFSLKRSE